jgi:hypothetical protein
MTLHMFIYVKHYAKYPELFRTVVVVFCPSFGVCWRCSMLLKIEQFLRHSYSTVEGNLRTHFPPTFIVTVRVFPSLLLAIRSHSISDCVHFYSATDTVSETSSFKLHLWRVFSLSRVYVQCLWLLDQIFISFSSVFFPTVLYLQDHF